MDWFKRQCHRLLAWYDILVHIRGPDILLFLNVCDK